MYTKPFNADSHYAQEEQNGLVTNDSLNLNAEGRRSLM